MAESNYKEDSSNKGEGNNNFSYGENLKVTGTGHDDYTIPGQSADERGQKLPEIKTGENPWEHKMSPRQVFPNDFHRTDGPGLPTQGEEHGIEADGNNMEERRRAVYDGARNVDTLPELPPQYYSGLQETVDEHGTHIKVKTKESEVRPKEFHRREVANTQTMSPTFETGRAVSSHPWPGSPDQGSPKTGLNTNDKQRSMEADRDADTREARNTPEWQKSSDWLKKNGRT